MPLENRPEKDAGRRLVSPELRRALVFVGLGLVFGAFVAWSVVVVLAAGPVDLYGIPPAYLFCLIVCAITGPFDGVLAHVMPIRLRAPLIAVVGAAVPTGVFFLVAQGIKGPWSLIMLMMIVGAAAAGMSSLLSHNYRAARF
jgi:hypothetical protein